MMFIFLKGISQTCKLTSLLIGSCQYVIGSVGIISVLVCNRSFPQGTLLDVWESGFSF